MRNRIFIWIVVLCMSVILVACGSSNKEGTKQENDQTTEQDKVVEEDKGAITVTDLQGNDVEFDEVPERIVSLTSGDLHTIYALGAEAVGRPVIRAQMSDEIAALTEVGTSNDVDIEKIISLDPDLVIAHPQLNSEAIPTLEEMGIPVIQLGSGSVEGVKDSIDILGKVVQKEAEAKQLIDEIDDKIQAYTTADEEALRTLIVFGSAGNWMAALPDSLSGDMLEAVGGYNIAEDYEKLERFPQYASLDVEKIVEANPEVVFFITPGPLEETVQAFEAEMAKNPAWNNIEAIKKGHFISLPNELFGANPGAHITDSLDYLHEELEKVKQSK